ncbi:hypothetical protein AaE_014207 [Aphanomyces astaci]|uniref:Myb-like domain-containing protein n=1 Tax=Aphanomyces astaci TaxID=112090 RepID=A0A6A4Z8G4_APHAT|nr:hypothetical protein AaE_014207 [Aphanomyces astaci]
MELNSNSQHPTEDDTLDALYEEPGAYAGSTRKSFGCSDDITLLIAVNDAKPWTASSGSLMKTWTDIASDLKANRRFKVAKDGQGCKTRFDKLTKAYKERSLAAMRRSGTDEEFGECEQLLEDILSQVNDFVEKKDAQASLLASKKEGIEASGVMMRKLAMESMDAIDGSESGTPSKRTRVVDFLQHITTAVDNVTGEDPCLKMVTSFLKDRLEQEDLREEKRSRREDERDRKQHERDLARDKQMQEFLVALVSTMQKR